MDRPKAEVLLDASKNLERCFDVCYPESEHYMFP